MSSEKFNIQRVSPEIQKVLNVSSNRRERVGRDNTKDIEHSGYLNLVIQKIQRILKI